MLQGILLTTYNTTHINFITFRAFRWFSIFPLCIYSTTLLSSYNDVSDSSRSFCRKCRPKCCLTSRSSISLSSGDDIFLQEEILFTHLRSHEDVQFQDETDRVSDQKHQSLMYSPNCNLLRKEAHQLWRAEPSSTNPVP